MLSVISIYDGAADGSTPNTNVKNDTNTNTNTNNMHSHAHSHNHENSHGHEHAHIHGFYFGGDERDVEAGDDDDDDDEGGHTAPRVGRRRQVVGILVRSILPNSFFEFNVN